MGMYVGELQERWQFPSDHLPIGMSLGNFNIASWNVLDSEYMDWVIEKNSQGLSRSMIADEHIYIDNSKLTIRDQHVVELILQMLQHPSYPKHLLSLQECGEPFLAELERRLPSNFTVLSNEGNAVVIDQSHFEIVNAKSVAGIFSNEPQRTIQDITLRLKNSDENFRLVNGHLPGDPSKPGRFEFTQYLANTFDPNLATVAMGDMNFNELEMADAIKQAFPDSTQPYDLYSPYCTNVSPYAFNSKAIDHFIVHSTKKPVLHKPDEVMMGLSLTANLLSKFAKTTFGELGLEEKAES
jgi:endonuclease/exonuclease/phosphatase family metal-dependent hydrolase